MILKLIIIKRSAPALPKKSILKINAYLNRSNSPELIENNLFSSTGTKTLISDFIEKVAKINGKKLNIDLFNGLENWDCAVNENEYHRILSDALEGYSVYFLTLKKANSKEYKFQFESLNFLSSDVKN